MSETFELKPIAKDTVSQALELAGRYRLLNDPVQAESICLDILAVEPDHEGARIEIIRAMSEQFAGAGASPSKQAILDHVAKLGDEYDRLYLTGLVCEREAISFLERGQAAMFAYDGLRDAMDWYEKAEKIRPEGNDDAILRWNSCVRTIRRERLKPPPQDDGPLQLE